MRARRIHLHHPFKQRKLLHVRCRQLGFRLRERLRERSSALSRYGNAGRTRGAACAMRTNGTLPRAARAAAVLMKPRRLKRVSKTSCSSALFIFSSFG
jgi:hypothetical protein